MDAGNTGEKKKRYILLVDKNVDDRFHTSMLLQRFGYNICTTNTVQEAIEFLHVTPPAAIVTEGGLTGLDLLSGTKKNKRFSDIPIILLSSDAGRLSEYAAALRKPVNAEELYRAIQAVVEKTPRKNIRIATALHAKLDKVEGEAGKGYVTVLSEFGMFFRTNEPQDLNARVPISLEIKGRAVKLEAVVLNSYSLESSPFSEPGMGMKFVKISPEDQALIKAFILEQVEEGLS